MNTTKSASPAPLADAAQTSPPMTHAAAHSPTPWRIVLAGEDYGEPADTEITRMEAADGTQTYYTEGGYFRPRPGDAEFIIKAVNAHDELVAALRLVVSMHAMPDGLYRDKIGAMKAARAALAKAEA